jgi:hypothetical protein
MDPYVPNRGCRGGNGCALAVFGPLKLAASALSLLFDLDPLFFALGTPRRPRLGRLLVLSLEHLALVHRERIGLWK